MTTIEEKNAMNEIKPIEKTADASGIPALSGLPGISDNTKATLNSIGSSSYTPSASVSKAMTELKDVIAKQPAEFQSRYYNQLSGVMNEILGRKEFAYDLSGDPMYRMYRDQYTSAGRKAMEDSMGQNSRLTGGYGSSYSAVAGQQTYNRYLNALNDRIPELYERSRSTYDARGDALKRQYDMLNEAYQQEYGAYQDEFDRWLKQRDAAFDAYRTELDSDRTAYYNDLDNSLEIAKLEQQRMLQLEEVRQQHEWKLEEAELQRKLQLEKAEQEQANADRQYFYKLAMDMIDMGKTPSDNILRSAGLTDEDIAALTGKNKSSSGSKKTGSSTAASKNSAASSGTSSLKSITRAASKSKLAGLKDKMTAMTGR